MNATCTFSVVPERAFLAVSEMRHPKFALHRDGVLAALTAEVRR